MAVMRREAEIFAPPITFLVSQGCRWVAGRGRVQVYVFFRRPSSAFFGTCGASVQCKAETARGRLYRGWLIGRYTPRYLDLSR